MRRRNRSNSNSLSASIAIMFKRPHSSKTTTPIRSSDLRKLREQVSSAFDCADSIKRLLPDGSLSGKATTHLDEPVTIYYAPAASSSTDPDPRFFRLGKGTDGPLVPTSYAFDLVPTLLPHLETAQQVVDNLTSGSGEVSVRLGSSAFPFR